MGIGEGVIMIEGEEFNLFSGEVTLHFRIAELLQLGFLDSAGW